MTGEHLQAELREYTSFRLGGPCRRLVECSSPDALCEAAAEQVAAGVPFRIIGQGTNLLVSDAGTDEIVLRFVDEQAAPEIRADSVTVSGGMPLDALVQQLMERGIGDLTFCSGIPGTVGGAVAGNAGAFGRQIGDALLEAEVLFPDGSRRTLSATELGFAYRHSALRAQGAVVLRAVLGVESVDRDALQARRDEIMTFRKTHHPDWRVTPCAGSFFRNIEPSSAAERRQAAGWFLDQAGARQMRVGGARVFEKHANIIIAEPGCKAQDVYALSEQMKAAVRSRFGLELVREAQLIGAFDYGSDRSGSEGQR
jgi:UDP-N-acetylmuramate dehydrogenase